MLFRCDVYMYGAGRDEFMCGRCSLCPSVGSLPGCTRMYNAVSVVVFHFRASGIDLAGNRDGLGVYDFGFIGGIVHGSWPTN